MSLGLIGKKIGMTKIFDSQGFAIPVTLINIPYNYVTQIKNFNNDNYSSLQISCCIKKNHNMNKPFYGKLIKSNILSKYISKEFIINDFDLYNFTLWDILPLNIFYINQKVSISSLSIGKGFSGVVKRYNFKCGKATHGNSKAHNKPGSIGMSQDPGRVFLGKKMPGRLGFKKVTIKNLKIIKIDFTYNLIFIKGGVPGFRNSNVFICSI